ncbi:aromatic prenyltransferase (DMATS family) [Taiwanofungus camphoratus]|uniref:O-prenyltransferase n=1 Tax=Taiwanofungus camphoratus TaxID=2696576 RepID=A0A6B9P4H3_TAICA|nr:aromatic prenyltransferase (DMATS family) [Antrodia cinnamomea]KAI0929352.1 aromatic prenyltransferase (DMATS family) [Antrodia cinnamomea]KAI0946408.1 aromatic prenyltransferase (DMATS family) [Antrodia cinnamomea]QHD39928.1 O-prenyltransferase [Taiwanofungus camphoratus]
MIAAPVIATSPISPILTKFPPTLFPTRKTVAQSVFDILNSTLRFNENERFWWGTSGRVLASMFQRLGYSVDIQFIHMLFFHVRVLPFMGPRPDRANKPAFKSYMTDDHTPIEVSWIVNPDGTATVRYAIEPIDTSAWSRKPAALRMIDELRPVLKGLDMKWFHALDEALVWHGRTRVYGAKHTTQYFLGFDCSHTGSITLKAYFLPEVKSAKTGIRKEDLVMMALRSLNAGLTAPWAATMAYFNTLPAAIRPGIEIVATDCAAPKDSRIKIYVRTRSTNFRDLEGLMTLGGKLKGSLIDDAIAALMDLWNLVMGVDTSKPGWKDKRLPPRVSVEANDNHITGGLLLYYELKPGQPLPFPKVYLPVRHYCADDLAVARGMEAYHRKKGSMFLTGYVEDVESIFGRHRPLEARTGIHTYVSLAIKKSDFEVTSYFNPEAYAPERFPAPARK